MRQRDDMTFPHEEYVRRLEGLRERMKERRLDAVVISDPENIMYMTDYQTTGYSFFQALIVPLLNDVDKLLPLWSTWKAHDAILRYVLHHPRSLVVGHGKFLTVD